MASPPPLPPREVFQLPPPPPYLAVEEPRRSPVTDQENPSGPAILLSKAPLASSSQSLAPSRSESDARRTLLLVYIHGFYGNDQSFQSFPAHVHNFLREALSETHVVCSKVYPRYKTYKAIGVARDNFSAWLEPHESPATDVVLIGHSMGGLLAAEIVLMPTHTSPSRNPLKHRILGTLSLDSPFLGLHPGIVASGISSLFQPAPVPPGQDASSPSPKLSPSADPQPISSTALNGSPLSGSTDPNFDPPYFNDAPFREQPFVARMLNFGSKHWSEGILTALGNHVVSHLEFGGCLADYRGLVSRYNQIRALEDVDDLQALGGGSSGGSRARVRFLNYYTLSPGRPKPSTPAKGSRGTSQVDLSSNPASESKAGDETNDKLADVTISTMDDDEKTSQTAPDATKPSTLANGGADLNAAAACFTSKDGKNSNDAGSIARPDESDQFLDLHRLSMQEIDPIPMDEAEHDLSERGLETAASNISDLSSPPFEDATDGGEDQSEQAPGSLSDLELPPIPNLPHPPEQPDLSQYADRDSRKQAEKEFGRRQKAYEHAAKDRSKAIREREKLLEKRQKKAQKDAQKDADRLEKDLKKQKQKSEQDRRRLEREEEKAAKAEKKRLEKEAAAAAKQLADETSRAAIQAAASSATPVATPETESETASKPKKLGKFCSTPSKTNGVMDPTWVSVYMDGMDEVTAHCGLFFPGPHYDRLVGDVGGRIVSWVHNDLSVRAMLEMG
ncbi:hypothetical protein Trco_001229 [Trichoderma cornu-damae]|uniref:DUF676 domain-containing protein n=1 Tax=Trichoderma cornu-damae TaxID=654480 RepID=A0A9P8TZR6_9HYPO|nr:hypothetical protein Trco_001229 [Trichoderma cornu-damae]